jgi:methylenetetrahydrofolate reductase (NADPH)
VITQLFYEKEAYFHYINKLKTLGIQIPVIAGILPISDHEKIFNFAKSCGAKIPQELKNIFTADLEDKVKYEKANRFMAKMVSDLIREGAAGIHFYTLNRSLQTANILKEIMKDFSEVNAA